MNQTLIALMTRPVVLASIVVATLTVSIIGFLPIDSYPFAYIKLSALLLGTLTLLFLLLLVRDRKYPRLALPLAAATLLYGLAVFVSGLGVGGTFVLGFESLDYRTVTGVGLFILFGYLAAHVIKPGKLIRHTLGIITVAVLVTLGWGLLSSSGFLPVFENGFAQQALVAMALLMSIVGVFTWEKRRRLFAGAMSIFFFLAGILLFSQAVWLLCTVVAAIVFGSFAIRKHTFREVELVLVAFGFGFALLISVFYAPAAGFRALASAPSQQQSISVARAVLVQAPLTGAGPTHFVDAYSAFLPAGTNATPTWGLRYFSGASRFATMAVENGLLTLAAFILLGAAGIVASMRLLFVQRPDESAYRVPLAASWLVLFGAYVVMPGSFVHDMLFWVFTAMLAMADVGESQELPLVRKVKALFSGALLRNIATGAVGLVLLSSLFLVGVRASAVVAFESGRKSITENNVDAGLRAFRQATKWNPNSSRTWTALANTAVVSLAQSTNENNEETLTEGQLALGAEAEGAANSSAETQTGGAAGMTFRAEIFEQLALLGLPGMAEKALASREFAVELDPGNPAYHVALGIFRFDAGSRFAEVAIAEEQEEQEEVAPLEGEEPTSRDKATAFFAAAEQAFQNAAIVKPDYAPTYPGLSAIAAVYGNAQGALDAAAQATSLDPSNVSYLLAYAGLLTQTGQADAAVNILGNALTLNPENTAVQFELARALATQEETLAAKTILTRLLEQDPTNGEAQQLLDFLTLQEDSEGLEQAGSGALEQADSEDPDTL